MFADIRSVHFVGVGGTAMASVAAAMKDRGFRVTGSDQNVYPPMSTFLAERRVEVREGYAEANLGDRPDLVVIGNAISRGNPEAEAVLDRKLRYCSLPELLKEFFLRGRRCLVVAGTHGKTTTTSLLAWVFERNGLNPSYLIGGMPVDLGQGCRITDSEWFILEGDEYDTAFFDKRSKFVHYLPETAILNNLEYDHADIFESVAAIQKSFSHFIRLVPRSGLLLANGEDANLAPLLGAAPCPLTRFGLGPECQLRAENVRHSGGMTEFEVAGVRFRLNLAGEFNVRNALGVIGCARHYGLPDAGIQSALESFQGVRRRMEVRGVAGGVTVVDDFGHHPTAIRETLKALRQQYSGSRLWAVFEPRSNTTRRRVFQEELAGAFVDADRVVVAQVARLEQLRPEDRLDPERLIGDLVAGGRPAAYLADVGSIVEHVAGGARTGDVVCVFSNGGFGGIHQRLLERLGR